MWDLSGNLRRKVDAARVEQAIREAEQRTSAEIRVSVAHFFYGDVARTAGKAFRRLGIARTRARNGVLIFLVPSRRQFTVLGDAGVHEKAGQAFWDGLAACLSEHFHRGEFTEGLVEGIRLAGEGLAVHFPVVPGQEPDELPDEVDFH